MDKVVTFTFGDKTVGLHVRGGIVEFLPESVEWGGCNVAFLW